MSFNQDAPALTFDPITLITTTDHSAASYQILEKLCGTYNYSCPVHEWPFEIWYDREHWFQFEQDNLARPAYGSTVIESRYPTFNTSSPHSALCSEVSIVSTIHLQSKNSLCATITDVFILRLEGHQGKEVFSLWRPKRRSDGAVLPVASLRQPDLEHLGYLHLKCNQTRGVGMDQYQCISLEMRRTAVQMDLAEDYGQPWELFKICMYIGPGVSSNLAGKQAGFEIRRSEPYWLFTEKEGLYDWKDGRVELFAPADKATEAKWAGVSHVRPLTGQSKPREKSNLRAREDSVIRPEIEHVHSRADEMVQTPSDVHMASDTETS